MHYTSSPEIDEIAASAFNAINIAFYARTVSSNMVDSSGNSLNNLSGLKWAFFDQATPHLFTAPVNVGSSGTTDGTGKFTSALTNSSLSPGQTGWLSISNSDGTAAQTPSSKGFGAPVVVS